MTRSLSDPNARMLNHAEFVYAPGDRTLTARLFEALGCRVVDPQRESGPDNLGPAASPYLIIYLDRGSDDVIDNVFYASEVTPVQWAFERAMRQQLEEHSPLSEAAEGLRAAFSERPQAMTHIGLAFPSAEELEEAVARLAADAHLAPRVRRSKIYRPGEPDSADDRVVQTFIHTDVCSNSLLTTGQQFELQVRLDL